MPSIEKMSSWIGSTLIAPDGFFSPKGFAFSLELYSTSLGGSFVLSVVDGSASAAPFQVPQGRSKYNELIRTIQRVSASEPAFWFYGTDPDNALSILSWVRPCDYTHALNYPLESFETEPAQEGGRSWLALAAESGQWLLAHEHDPQERLRIAVYGSEQFCKAVASGVGLKGVRGGA